MLSALASLFAVSRSPVPTTVLSLRLTLKVDGKYYYINVGDCMEVMLVNKGDTVEITTDGGKGTFIQAKSITVK